MKTAMCGIVPTNIASDDKLTLHSSNFLGVSMSSATRNPKIATADRGNFIVLKRVNKTPSLASCGRCQRKFFTPNTYYNDPYGAEEYLQSKFDLHDCRKM